MSSQRQSCDRCRQHKVRCLKIGGETQPAVERGSSEYLATCERCAKAEVPCVYSSRQRKARGSSHRPRRDTNTTSFMRTMPFGQEDLAGVLSGECDGLRSSLGSSLGDTTMPLLDITDMTVPGFDDGDFFGWDNGDPSPSSISAALQESNGEFNFGVEKDLTDSPSLLQKESESPVDALIGEVVAVTTRATRATRQLDRGGNSAPLMVNSPEINEAFETANALVQIVNKIPLASSAPALSPHLPYDEKDPQLAAGYGLIFLALASHQQILALFRAICVSIQRSVGFKAPGTDRQEHPPAVHGDGASCAQFVMVLQLVMHLVNRLGRSLRIESQSNAGTPRVDGRATSAAMSQPQQLTPRVEGEDDGGGLSSGFVDIAYDMLKRLPDEHFKLRQTIQQLQTHMEERLHT